MVTRMPAPQAPSEIKEASWRSVRDYLDENWDIKNSPHISVVGMTGTGKSYLMTRGILPLCLYDHVLIIDVKGDDETLRGFGKPVKAIPRHDFDMRNVIRGNKKAEPRRWWYRLVIPEDPKAGHEVLKTALQRVYSEGHWIVVVDETRALTDSQAPGYNVRTYLEQIWLRGRSRGVALVAMTQAPKWVPGTFYNAPSFLFISRVNDEDSQKRLREVGGIERAHLPVISNIPRRVWLFIAEGGDHKVLTKVTSAARRLSTKTREVK